VAAQLGDPGLERDARARRRLLEEQRDGAPREGSRGQRLGLELERAVEQPPDLGGRQLRAGDDVPWLARQCTVGRPCAS
jgi:hypothetical protein